MDSTAAAGAAGAGIEDSASGAASSLAERDEDAQNASNDLSRSFTQGAESPTLAAEVADCGEPAEFQSSGSAGGCGVDDEEFVFVPAPLSKATAAAAAAAAAENSSSASSRGSSSRNVLPPAMPQARALTSSMRLAAHCYSLHSPDGAPVTLRRRHAHAANASDGGGASFSNSGVLKTSSQYTKALRYMAAQNLISFDQLHYLDRAVQDSRNEESRIIRRLILEFSTATHEELKSRIFNQLLDSVPEFAAHEPAYFPFPVEHVSWVEKVSTDVWAPVAADDVLILEHASWRLNNAATGTGAAAATATGPRAEKSDNGIDQRPDEVFIDTGRTSVNLSRRIASSRYRDVPRRPIVRMTWYFEWFDSTNRGQNGQPLRQPFAEHLARKAEAIYKNEVLFQRSPNMINGTPPHPFRDCMWEAGGHKDYGGARPRPLRVSDHFTAFVSIFCILGCDPNYERLRSKVTCVCRGVPKRPDFPFDGEQLLHTACARPATTVTSGTGVGTVTEDVFDEAKAEAATKAAQKIHEQPECHDVVFLVHGIGQAIKSESAPSVLKHATAMRKAWRTQLNAEYDRAVELARKKKLRLSHKAVRQQMVEVIPVEWASTLLGEYSGLQNSTIKDAITPDGVAAVRELLNERIYDALLYLDSSNGDELLNHIVEQLNANYHKFCEAHPDFNGRVSFVAHSLGSVIVHDLLTRRSDKLAFPVASTFVLGSILPLFLSSRHQAFGQHWTYPNQMRFFSIAHPFDAVSYRFEPLVDLNLADVAPVTVPNPPKNNHLFSEEQVERLLSEGVAPKPTNPTNMDDDAPAFGLLNAGKRIDFCIRASAPKAFQYFALMSAHSNYFANPQVHVFILSVLSHLRDLSAEKRRPQAVH